MIDELCLETIADSEGPAACQANPRYPAGTPN